MNVFISKTFVVKGAAIDASASESDSPTLASFKAAQSLAPSPHIPIVKSKLLRKVSTRIFFRSGVILAYILQLRTIFRKNTSSINPFVRLSKISLNTFPSIA